MRRPFQAAPFLPTRPDGVVASRSRLERAARALSLIVVLGTFWGVGAVVASSGQPTESGAPAAALAAKFSAMEAARTPASSHRSGEPVPWIVPAPVDRAKRQEQLPAPGHVPPSPGAVEAPAAPAPSPEPAKPAAVTDVASPRAPVECLPAGMRAVLRDVENRFGAMTLVSTTTLHTDNHGRGSVRHRLHTDCRAVDFKIRGDVRAVTAYLRTRPEVAGITAFGNNGVIHIDHNAARRMAAR